ncbi:hypothetical protein CHS0354_019003 [Potamilus streckersoni]|uniref:Mutator-like transposase domain-containing protein n=1 Tax=Potamilus streckersoni TaxID=2493646 RepID=A0AAE0SRF8_9BIVA|nr:hypothetical protein CHS0354_019003 [Potamilus streckersoni]
MTNKTCDCTANISMETNIGDEETLASECLLNLKEDNFEVRDITTDPDTSSYGAAVKLYNEGFTHTILKNFIDTRHFSENHRKYIKRCPNLVHMIPGLTKAARQKMRDRFAIDLTQRCQVEFENAFNKLNGNTDRVKSCLSYSVDAIVQCYQGDHSLCTDNSYACKGDWLEKSPYLPFSFKEHVTKQSEGILRDCINYRLGPLNLEKTKFNTNSQKVEAANRVLRRSLPRNITWTRNFPGRAHSAVHSLNNGPGESILKLCNAIGCSIKSGTRVAQTLAQEQKFFTRYKAYK